MNQIFFRILNMSIVSGLLVSVVFVLRLILRRAPKWIIVILWGIVALRLIIPFNFESPISAVPQTIASGALVQEITGPGTLTEGNGSVGEEDIASDENSSGLLPDINSKTEENSGAAIPEASAASGQRTSLLSWLKTNLWLIWFCGTIAMLIYALVSFIKLKITLAASIRIEDGDSKNRIFASDNIASPFLLGIIRPSIYVPSEIALTDSTEAKDLQFILQHEKAHISRGDHLWKPLGYILLSINWFNPLIWLGYILLCRDIESACDEKVIRQMDEQTRAEYSRTLLNFSAPGHGISACPVAFGETGTKSRIKAVLNYKKPALWLIIAAIVLCIAVGIFFLTVRTNKESPADATATNASVLEKGESYWQAASVNSSLGEPYVSVRPMLHFQGSDDEKFSFTLSYDPISSYLSIGKAIIKDESIICKTDDGLYTYLFDFKQISDAKYVLVFKESGSNVPDNFTSIVPDGTEFEFAGMDEDEATQSGWTLISDNTPLLDENDMGLQRWNYAAENEDDRLADLTPVAIIGSRNIGMGVDPDDTSKFAYLAFCPIEDEYPAGWRIVVLQVGVPMVEVYNYFTFLSQQLLPFDTIIDSDWEFGLNTSALSKSEHINLDELAKLDLADEGAQSAFESVKNLLGREMYPVALLGSRFTEVTDYMILCATDAEDVNGSVYIINTRVSTEGEVTLIACNRLNMPYYIEKSNIPPLYTPSEQNSSYGDYSAWLINQVGDQIDRDQQLQQLIDAYAENEQ